MTLISSAAALTSTTLPMTSSFLSVTGGARVYAVKNAEDGKGIIIRLADSAGNGADAVLTFCTNVTSACTVDSHEEPIASLPVNGKSVTVSVPQYAISAVRVIL